MNFKEALENLGIEKYAVRITKSNSNGELFHLQQYFLLAELIKKTNNKEAFTEWFEIIVKYAEENWERPESVFQHIFEYFKEFIDNKIYSNNSN